MPDAFGLILQRYASELEFVKEVSLHMKNVAL